MLPDNGSAMGHGGLNIIIMWIKVISWLIAIVAGLALLGVLVITALFFPFFGIYISLCTLPSVISLFLTMLVAIMNIKLKKWYIMLVNIGILFISSYVTVYTYINERNIKMYYIWAMIVILCSIPIIILYCYTRKKEKKEKKRKLLAKLIDNGNK
jgi:peptidoglycan/LPS O-acetylase OafA/YrhL